MFLKSVIPSTKQAIVFSSFLFFISLFCPGCTPLTSFDQYKKKTDKNIASIESSLKDINTRLSGDLPGIDVKISKMTKIIKELYELYKVVKSDSEKLSEKIVQLTNNRDNFKKNDIIREFKGDWNIAVEYRDIFEPYDFIYLQDSLTLYVEELLNTVKLGDNDHKALKELSESENLTIDSISASIRNLEKKDLEKNQLMRTMEGFASHYRGDGHVTMDVKFPQDAAVNFDVLSGGIHDAYIPFNITKEEFINLTDTRSAPYFDIRIKGKTTIEEIYRSNSIKMILVKRWIPIGDSPDRVLEQSFELIATPGYDPLGRRTLKGELRFPSGSDDGNAETIATVTMVRMERV